MVYHRAKTSLRTLNYGNYGIFLIMGNAGFLSSTVPQRTKVIPKRNALSPPAEETGDVDHTFGFKGKPPK